VVVLGAVGAYGYSRYRARRVIPLPYNSATILRPPVAPRVAGTPVAPKPSTQPAKPVPTPPIAAATQIDPGPAGNATVLHTGPIPTAQKPPQVSIKIAQTVDASQLREVVVRTPCLIGRENAQLTITGDPKISRSHAQIKVENDQFVIVDQGSANGTFVANNRLEKGVPVPITGPTTIRLGPNTVLEVKPKA
jgi:hypothetical protein